VAALPEFTRLQHAFTAHIRDPERNPAPPDVEERRMRIYRELFYNNVESFMSSTFPVLRQIHTDAAWHALVREYFSRHAAQTPLFHEMPREFLNWLQNEHTPGPGELPFLCELAHYEWVELALSIAEEPPASPDVDPDGDLLLGVPVLSPLAWHLCYRYPVHRIGPDYLPQEPGATPTCLVVYRDRDDAVGFLEINTVTKRLLELIAQDGQCSGTELLRRVAQELSHPQPQMVVQGGSEILEALHRKQVLAGTKRS